MAVFKIAVIPGDGIGPEVTRSTCEVLNKVAQKSGNEFLFTEVSAGGIAIDTFGEPLPEKSLQIAKDSDAVLLGAVGGPKWDDLPGRSRPEAALLGLRKELALYANLRLAILFPELKSASPLRPDLVENGVDILIVRELTGGIYFGKRGLEKSEESLSDGTPKGMEAFDVETYSEAEIERILRVGFTSAMQRRKSLTILSDEAGMITGSIGMLPSASLGTPGTPGMYEPVHGSAPDIAGKGIANPLATILSAAMMLRYSLGLPEEGEKIEKAVGAVLRQGYRTTDIASSSDANVLGTKEMTEKVIEEYEKL